MGAGTQGRSGPVSLTCSHPCPWSAANGDEPPPGPLRPGWGWGVRFLEKTLSPPALPFCTFPEWPPGVNVKTTNKSRLGPRSTVEPHFQTLGSFQF